METLKITVLAKNGIPYTPSKFKNGFNSEREAIREANILSITLFGRNNQKAMTGKVILRNKNNNVINF